MRNSLDKYLTTPPDDGFDNWCEDTCNSITDMFFWENETWINEYSGQCNKWLNELFKRSKSTIEAAQIIERAFKLFIRLNIPKSYD